MDHSARFFKILIITAQSEISLTLTADKRHVRLDVMLSRKRIGLPRINTNKLLRLSGICCAGRKGEIERERERERERDGRCSVNAKSAALAETELCKREK